MSKSDLVTGVEQRTNRAANANTADTRAGDQPGSSDPYRSVLSRERILSGLDASTGKLTGDQQRIFADLPKEEWQGQPGTRHKVRRNPDGSAEYQGLAGYSGSMLVSLPNSNIDVVTHAIRP